MKEKIQFYLFNAGLIVLLSAVFAISACAQFPNTNPNRVTNSSNYLGKINSLDTIILASCSYEKPILRNRYDCNMNLLPHQKVVGWEKNYCNTISIVRISDKWLRDKGYAPVTKVDPPADSINESSKDFWNNLGFWDGLALWLLAWLVVILLALLLWKFGRGDFDSKAPAPTPTPTTPPTMKERSDAMANAIKSMSENNVAVGEVSFGEGVTGKFTFNSEKKVKVLDKKPEDKKQ